MLPDTSPVLILSSSPYLPFLIKYQAISLTYNTLNNTLQSSQPSYLRQMFTIQPSCSTCSSSALTLFHPSVTSWLKFENRSIYNGNKLPSVLLQISDPSYKLPKTSPLGVLLSLHSSFILNWKHCFSTNPTLIHPLLHISLSISIPNTIHLSCLTVCLPDSLDFDLCLSILFWINACE